MLLVYGGCRYCKVTHMVSVWSVRLPMWLARRVTDHIITDQYNLFTITH